MGHRLRLADAHLFHAQLVGGQHLDADAIALHHFSGLGNAPQPLAYQPAHRGGFDVLFADGTMANRSATRSRSKLPETM